MRKELKETGRLEKASAALNWFSILWKIKQKNPEPNYDNFNTQMYNMLTGIMLIGDDREKATALKCFSRWISKGMWVNTDSCGSAHHHNMLHPGYVFRPLVMLTKVNLILSNSDFALGQEARQLLKNAVLAMHFAHYGETPRGIAGRCPQVRTFDSDCEGLLNLALAGSPDGKEKIDLEAAAYYIAKKGVNDKYSKKFLAQGIQPAGMKGFLPLQGACVGIQRRGDFLVAVDGMNTFRRGTEFYGWTDTVHAYAKYLNFGSLQIFLKGKPSREANGWKVEGWDFNHWPGVTNAVLPQQKLYTYYGAVNNASAFCGSTELDGNGVWAMELNSFRQKAHKSVFFFDNVLVCVGSAINNKESGNTVTTLFQSELKSPNEPIIDNGKKITGFPWNKSTKKPVWLMDNMGNGYIVPAGNPALNVARRKQQMTYTLAKYRKDGRNSKKRNDRSVFRIDGKPYNLSDYKTTSADYALAWLDHGKAPRNGKYAYTVIVNSNPAEVKKQFDAPDWKILRQDKDIHIVESVKSGMTGYVFFKSQNKVPGKSLIKFVSRPCIVMTKRTGDKLELSVASPVKNDKSSFVIIVEGLWQGKGAVTSAKFTKIVIPFKNFMPHKLVLTAKK
jgi:chondroitin-sulfate-ABC endolyase/exolyase